MGVLPHRDRIARVQRDIAAFQVRASELLRRERMAEGRVRELEALSQQPCGRLRRRRRARALARARNRALSLASERQAFVEQGLRAIMLTLDEISHHTRERLDHELERLEPVQADWERLRQTFTAVEAAVATPAIDPLAGQLHGKLEIPDFPVEEHEGYPKPFPRRVVLF